MSLRPLVLWVTRQPSTTMRFTRRDPEIAEGVLNGPSGTVAFTFARGPRRLRLPDRTVNLDDYGWEIDENGQIVFQSRSLD